jgi:hypothetical protein
MRSQISCESICHSHNTTKGITFESLWFQTWTDSYTMLQSNTSPFLFLAHLCLHLSNVVCRPIRHRGECRFDFSWWRCTITKIFEITSEKFNGNTEFIIQCWPMDTSSVHTFSLVSRCVLHRTFYSGFFDYWNSPMSSYINVMLTVWIRIKKLWKNWMTGFLEQSVFNALFLSWSTSQVLL